MATRKRAKSDNPFRSRTQAFAQRGGFKYLRRKIASPALLQRLRDDVRAGKLMHVRTDDDVEVYAKPKRKSVTDLSNQGLVNEVVRSACAREFQRYRDALSELRARMLGSDLPIGTSQLMFNDMAQYIALRIARRGGPSMVEIMRETQQRKQNRQIYLPN